LSVRKLIYHRVDGADGGASVPKRPTSAELLRISEERFRILMETMPIAVFVWDGERPVFVNAAAERMSGYSREELMKMSPWSLVHPDSLPHLQEQYAKDQRGEEIPRQYELKMLTRSGEPRWVVLTFDWLHLTEADSLMMGTAMDITERKLSEDAVRESEARFRILYQDNPSMYFTVDPAGTVLDVNAFGASQLGYAPQELVGGQVLDVFHPEDREAVREHLAGVLANSGEAAVWEFRKVRKNGDVIWVKEIARATRGASGEPIVLIVCEDITAWKAMEDALQNVREEIEGRVERAMSEGSSYGLTFRERTVLHLVSQGKVDKEVAAILGISHLTVSKHVTNILSKMGASSRAEASARAVRERLLD
jgi:PAS domain S-box-containing protein